MREKTGQAKGVIFIVILLLVIGFAYWVTFLPGGYVEGNPFQEGGWLSQEFVTGVSPFTLIMIAIAVIFVIIVYAAKGRK